MAVLRRKCPACSLMWVRRLSIARTDDVDIMPHNEPCDLCGRMAAIYFVEMGEGKAGGIYRFQVCELCADREQLQQWAVMSDEQLLASVARRRAL